MDEPAEPAVGGSLTKARLKFFAGLAILLLPLLIWLYISQLGEVRCKPLMLLKTVDANNDSIPHVIPDFSLTNQNGQVFTQDSLKGYYHVANFIFTTCPGICIPMTQQFKNLQAEIKDSPEVRLVSFTVDPETDTPEVLKKYAKKYGAIPGKWTFLTGKDSLLTSIIKDGYKQAVMKTPDGQEKVTHSPFFVLIDKDLHVRGFYNALDPHKGEKEFKRILEEINVLGCEYNSRKKE